VRPLVSAGRPPLEALLDAAQTAPADELPRLLGDLEMVRCIAMARLAAPATAQPKDELLSVQEAAQRLGVSVDYLYRHHREFPFTRPIGRRVLCSSLGIEQFIAQKKPLATKRI